MVMVVLNGGSSGSVAIRNARRPNVNHRDFPCKSKRCFRQNPVTRSEGTDNGRLPAITGLVPSCPADFVEQAGMAGEALMRKSARYPPAVPTRWLAVESGAI
jgi:hypothetical protein